MNTPNQKEFLRLVTAYLEGTATNKQKSTVEQYFYLFNDQADVTDSMDKVEMTLIRDRMKDNIHAKINNAKKLSSNVVLKGISVAASLIFASTIYIYFYQIQNRTKAVVINGVKETRVEPGGNKAILTLSNGAKIFLNNTRQGRVALQSGVTITNKNDSGLVYSQSKFTKGEMLYNRIETPKGGQYQITLPDGTKVWLNANSSLKYPLSFSGKERKVELSGEAYFEVSKDQAKAFKVYTKDEIVEVVGTHFIISAYTDEPAIKTSLLEGIVKVSSRTSDLKKTLKAGQQAILDPVNQNFNIKYVDIDEALAWKNGYFTFDREPLGSILRKIARWYDVDIDYSNANKWQHLSFNGSLSRYADVSKVLNMLEKTEAVKFKFVGRNIHVIPIMHNDLR